MARGLNVVDQLPPVDITSRPAVNAFTTFQDIYGAPQKILPKARMEPGLTIELFAGGTYGTTGTPTMSGGFWINGAALAAPTTILGQSQLAVSGASGQAAGYWNSYLRATLRAIGTGAAGGSWRIASGFLKIASTTSPFNTLAEWSIPVTDALRTVTFDCTADRALGVGWQWGTSSASNTVTVDSFELRCAS